MRLSELKEIDSVAHKEAFENITEQRGEDIAIMAVTEDWYVAESFNFDSSPQGHEYWRVATNIDEMTLEEKLEHVLEYLRGLKDE